MNKAYKLVWSEARQMYVAVCEFAKSHTKSCHSKALSRSVAAGVLACVISCGAYMPFAEAAYNMTRTQIDDDNFYAVTDAPDVVGNDAGSIAIGRGATIRNSGSNAVAIGDYTYAREGSIAIGARYDAQEWHIDGQGDNIYGTSAEGAGDIVLGAASHITGNNTIALGNTIISSANKAVIIGAGANATADNSVAIGAGSIASEANTISVGSNSLKRKLVNVAYGTGANDVAAIGQLQTVTAGTNVKLVKSTNANGSTNQQIVVEGTGQVANGNTGLINGNTAFKELRPANGTYVKQANTTAANLTALDKQTKSNTDGLAAEITNRTNALNNEKTARENADTALSNRIGTLFVDGSYIKEDNNVSQNLKALDDKIGVASVANGTFAKTANTVNANIKALDTAAANAIKGMTANGKTITYTKGDGTTGTVVINGTGTVSNGNTELINGGTAYTELRPANGTYVKRANTTAANLSALDVQTKSNTDAIKTLGDNKANKDASNVAEYDQQWADAIGTGEITATDTRLVTGKTVYDMLHDPNTEINVKNVTTQKLTTNNAHINNELYVGGDSHLHNTYVDGILDVTGEATFHDKVTMEKDLLVKGELEVEQNAIFNKDVLIYGNETVKGDINADGNVNIAKDLTVEGKSYLNGDTNVGGNLVVDGTTTLNGELYANENAYFSKDVEVDGKLIVKNDSDLQGNVDVGKDLNVAGNGSFGGNLEVTGNERIHGNLTVDKDSLVRGNSTVEGNSDVLGTLHVAKDTTLDKNLYVGGNATVVGDTDLQGNASVAKDFSVGGNSDFTGDVDIHGKLHVEKEVNLDSKLSVGDDASFGRDVSVDRNLYIGGESQFDKDVTIGGFDGDVPVEGKEANLRVNGDIRGNSFSVINSDGSTTTYIDRNGINANGNPITNVGDGRIERGSTDAINGGQLWRTREDLKKDIETVGAHAAAMSNLHPMPADPDNKWSFAAAYGAYHSEKAGAVGLFYNPHENFQMNVSTSIGDSDRMYGAGVAWRFGSGKTKARAKAAEIENLKNAVRELQVQNLAFKKKLEMMSLDPNKLSSFPDVPDGHWADDAVSTLKGNGYIQGYPDGTFKGERPMTRYEYAKMLYNALMHGAPVKQEHIQEYADELRAIGNEQAAPLAVNDGLHIG